MVLNDEQLHVYMRENLTLPSFVVPVYPNYWLGDTHRASVSLHNPTNNPVLPQSSVVESVVVYEINKKLSEHIIGMFKNSDNQRAFYYKEEDEFLSFLRNVVYGRDYLLVDEWLNTKFHMLYNPYHFRTPPSLNTSTTISPIVMSGTLMDKPVYSCRGVNYQDNKMMLSEGVTGFVLYEGCDRQGDYIYYYFRYGMGIKKPVVYHIFNDENNTNDKLRLDLYHNYKTMRKIKDYMNTVTF